MVECSPAVTVRRNATSLANPETACLPSTVIATDCRIDVVIHPFGVYVGLQKNQYSRVHV